MTEDDYSELEETISQHNMNTMFMELENYENMKNVKKISLQKKNLNKMLSLVKPDNIHSEIQCGHLIGKEEI